MKKLLLFSSVIILIILIFWGCEKKESTIPPVLPPIGSMSIDFSNFETSKKSLSTDVLVKKNKSADKSNWILSASIAGVWNVILAINLAIPVESFKLTVNSTPLNIDDNKWEWKNNFTIAGGSYSTRLTGEIRVKDVKWQMFISRTGLGSFPELLWYQGTSLEDGTSGQWIVNHSVAFPEPMLQIDWKAAGQGISDIKYTYIREKKDDRSTDIFKSSFVEYGVTDNNLNAFYNVHQNAGEPDIYHDVFIVWNTTNHNGTIRAFYYYNDELWHCWNKDLDNINCN